MGEDSACLLGAELANALRGLVLETEKVLKWWQLFQGFWMLGKGQFLNYKNVHPYRLEKLEFTDVGKASISLDGRFLREKSCVPLRLSVIPDTLNFIINAE